MNIVGMGEKIVEKLLSEELIKTPLDIYGLKKADLENLEKFGELSASNLLENIEKSKKITLSKFLFALGIHHIGEETADLIAQSLSWKSNKDLYNRIISITDEDLTKIDGIGDTVAESFVDYFADVEHQVIVQGLLGVLSFEKQELASQKFAGMTFVITGTLETMSRDEAKAVIKSNGGKVSSSVSKSTDYVVVGENPGSKFDDAQKLGVKTLTEKEFYAKVSA
jgi:DNA ligase (NAD+)